MGGRAIKGFGIEAKRLPAKDYFELVDEVLNKLYSIYAAENVRLIPAYRSKADFGDADIIIKDLDYKHEDIVSDIISIFGCRSVHNDSVYSFPYKDFQIDLNYTPPELFETSLAYFSWNDAGNLCGRAYHTLGLKYGHNGLFYFIRSENVAKELTHPCASEQHVLRKVCLSKNVKEILEFAGFDYNKFLDGFNTLEEMFDWVCKGKYFNPEKFKYEHLNYDNRTRNKKRTTYNHFLEWLESNKNNYKIFEFNDNKLVYIPMIQEYFPVLKNEFSLAVEQYNRECIIYDKFNGHIASEWTGLIGKDLGIAIQKFLNSFSDKNASLDYIYQTSVTDIRNKFLESIK